MTSTLHYNDDLAIDLESYNHDNERVDTAIQSLESICLTNDILTDKDSTLDKTSLQLAQQSVECFLAMGRIGTPANRIVPSNESLGNNYDISEATLESIGEGIKNVFLSIINAIKKSFEWMWGLIKRLFGRGKDHEEKIESLKHQAEEVKEEVKNMSAEEQKADPYPRGADGWFTKVQIERTQILKKIVTSKGLMTKDDLNRYAGELARVYQLQPKNMHRAMQVLNDAKPDGQSYEVPFHPAQDNLLIKQVKRDKDAKVYSSLEFSAGEYIYVVVPPLRVAGNDSEHDFIKNSIKWADGLTIGKASVTRAPDLEKFKILEGDYVNADHLLEMISTFNKVLREKTDELKTFQSAKERFLNQFEALIKKEGVNLFSSNEKKAKRDEMMYYLKFFKKTMDQPAVMYYGECDAIIMAFEHLALYVLSYNRRNGNAVSMKEEEVKKPDQREVDIARRRETIQNAKNNR